MALENLLKQTSLAPLFCSTFFSDLKPHSYLNLNLPQGKLLFYLFEFPITVECFLARSLEDGLMKKKLEREATKKKEGKCL